MTRKELTDDELETLKQALLSAVKKEFIKNDVSYQERKDLKYIAGYRRERTETMSEVRQILREKCNASIVSVGANKVAIVKRKD